MFNLLIVFDGNGGSLKGWQSLLFNAWGMTRPTFNSIFNRCIDRGFDCGRKERSDKGESIFVSESRRNQTFTALNEYKIQRGQELRDSPDKMCGKMLREDFNRLDSHDKRYYELTTPNKLERSRHFKDELTDLLKKKKRKNCVRRNGETVG